nr:MAG TPA_asm: protein of unknown function (DUF5067) [Caudoviricetes sp.]
MKQSGWGIASLVCGIAGVLLACVAIGAVPAIIGLVCAIIALTQKGKGHGTAIAGLICSIVAIIIFIFASLVFDGSDSDKPKKVENSRDTESVDNATEASEEFFKVGDTVETEDLRITFLKAEPFKNEYDEAAKGNEYYKFEFEFINISDSDQYISSTDFNCYADGYDCEMTYADEGKALDSTLSTGKKTKGIVCFEVPKNFKDISLEYETDFWDESKVCFEVKNK